MIIIAQLLWLKFPTILSLEIGQPITSRMDTPIGGSFMANAGRPSNSGLYRAQDLDPGLNLQVVIEDLDSNLENIADIIRDLEMSGERESQGHTGPRVGTSGRGYLFYTYRQKFLDAMKAHQLFEKVTVIPEIREDEEPKPHHQQRKHLSSYTKGGGFWGLRRGDSPGPDLLGMPTDEGDQLQENEVDLSKKTVGKSRWHSVRAPGRIPEEKPKPKPFWLQLMGETW